jgi:hypothetical protein
MEHLTFSLGLIPTTPIDQKVDAVKEKPEVKIYSKKIPKAKGGTQKGPKEEKLRKPKPKTTKKQLKGKDACVPKRRQSKLRKAKKQIKKIESSLDVQLLQKEETVIEDLPYIAYLPPLDIEFDNWIESTLIESNIKLQKVPLKCTEVSLVQKTLSLTLSH